MLTWLSNYRDIALLVLRVGIGAIMVMYGWPKLAGGMHAWEKLGGAMQYLGISMFPVFWGFLCAVTETFGGVLLVLGFYFRPAAILLTINMAVATTMVYETSHGSFEAWAHPAELAILFFSLIFIGAGKYSIDRS
jgi:putative oxidoreductase